MKELRFLKENRKVDEKHVLKIKTSIMERGYISALPILISKDGYIIDGQHRYVACKELNIEPTFQIVEVDTSLLISLNNTQKGWKNEDYINYFAEKESNPCYIEFRNFLKKYKRTIVFTAILLSGRTDNGYLYKSIKAGKFFCKYDEKSIKQKEEQFEKAEKFFDVLKRIKINVGGRVQRAVCKILLNPNISIEKLMSKMERFRDKIYSCSTTENYLLMFEEIYNYHEKNKVSFIKRKGF